MAASEPNCMGDGSSLHGDEYHFFILLRLQSATWPDNAHYNARCCKLLERVGRSPYFQRNQRPVVWTDFIMIVALIVKFDMQGSRFVLEKAGKRDISIKAHHPSSLPSNQVVQLTHLLAASLI